MLRRMGRSLLRFAGRWGLPITMASLLAMVGVAAGYVNAQREPGVQRPILSRIAAARQDARLQRGFDVTVLQVGPIRDDARIVSVRDRLGTVFQVRVTADSIIKRDGKRVGIDAIRPNQRLAGLARRDGEGTIIVGASIVRAAPPAQVQQN